MVANGAGLVGAPPAAGQQHDDDGAEVTLEITDRLEPLEVVLASMKGVRLTARAQAFIRSSSRAARRRAGG